MSASTSQLPELSPELWSHIMSFCREPQAPGGGFLPQPTLAAALRVSSTLYHAAAPHLYSDISAHNLQSLFLGSVPPSSFLVNGAATATASLVASLARKNELLRHMQSLQIMLRPERSYDLAGIQPSEQSSYWHQEECYRMFHSLVRFLEYLADPVPSIYPPSHHSHLRARHALASASQNSPRRSDIQVTEGPALLPRLRTVRVGPNPDLSTKGARAWTNINTGQLASALLRLCGNNGGATEAGAPLPVTWCDRKDASLYSFSDQDTGLNVVENCLPGTYVMHVEHDDSWIMLWGTHNVVYLQREKRMAPAPSEEDVFAEDMSYLVQEGIELARPAPMWTAQGVAGGATAADCHRNDGTEVQETTATRAKRRTRLDVYGLVRLISPEDALIGGTLPILFGDDTAVARLDVEEAAGGVSEAETEEKDRDQMDLEAYERRLLDKIQAMLRDYLASMGDESPVLPDQVHLHGSWEAQPCPCCGEACVKPLSAPGEAAVEAAEADQ